MKTKSLVKHTPDVEAVILGVIMKPKNAKVERAIQRLRDRLYDMNPNPFASKSYKIWNQGVNDSLDMFENYLRRVGRQPHEPK